MAEPFISLQRVTKKFGPLTVIEDLDLDIEKGEFVSLLGPSGSGKTTLLMLLAGFERPSSGAVVVGGKHVEKLPPHRRNMGVVFQNYALFPHMSVRDNIAFPLKMRRVARGEIEARVTKALEMVQLGALAARKPHALSGGQQQRVALARALVFEPEVVLMDEPLGALDKNLREQMQLDIRDLHRQLGLTIVFVTHDQGEALTMSDRIAVFNQGKIEQIGSPHDIYDRPQSRFVAEFIGETNFLEGQITAHQGNELHLTCLGGLSLVAHCPPSKTIELKEKKLAFSIRPERINLSDPERCGTNILPARIIDTVYHGDHLRLVAKAGQTSFIIKGDRRQGTVKIGDEVGLSFEPSDIWLVGQ